MTVYIVMSLTRDKYGDIDYGYVVYGNLKEAQEIATALVRDRIQRYNAEIADQDEGLVVLSDPDGNEHIIELREEVVV